MKLFATVLVSLIAGGALPASAQTAPSATKPAVHTPTAATAAKASACAKAMDFSPKIPAVPAGSPCAKHLYTITTTPSAKLDYVSPVEGTELREFLGLEPVSFSLDYIDTKIGTGPLALPHKWYSIHYTGYLTDGTKFDSSYDRKEPIVIPYAGHKVIPGWDTGFGGMHIGGKRRLFIPWQLAYGAGGRAPQIPPRSNLIFDVELVSQSDTDPTPPAPPAAPTAPRAPSGGTGQGSGQAAPPASTPAPAPAAPSTPAPATPPPAPTTPPQQ